MSIFSFFIVAFGVLIIFIGTLGLFKFQDFLTRTHAASVIDTLGTTLIILGLVIVEGFTITSFKLILLLVLLLVSNSTISHILAQTFFKINNKKGEVS
tara:strand:+ start:670 stop:963 length:294 start_codon:yes stop_codon:yes gene_type:complete